MTTGRGPVDHRRAAMNDPLLQLPFETVLQAVVVLGCLYGAWSAAGLRRAYRSIGSGGLSLDVPYTDPDPPDRGGSR